MKLRPFHLAIPVSDIEIAKEFYGSKLGFSEGRSDDHWICLLYTSPSPRDVKRSRMPSSA